MRHVSPRGVCSPLRRRAGATGRVAPSANTGQLAFHVFLPIHFQLFVGTSTQDSDLDGVPDGQNDFPSDPTRS